MRHTGNSILICPFSQSIITLFITQTGWRSECTTIVYTICIHPKVYVLHYTHRNCSCRFGPLVRLWCMRFEAKHNYFKVLGKHLGNFKNLPKTLASRHQRLMCNYLVNHRKFSNLVDAVAVGTGMPYIATYVYGSLKTCLSTWKTNSHHCKCKCLSNKCFGEVQWLHSHALHIH